MPPTENQMKETYLCVVSEWQGGRRSGNCYPVFVLTQRKALRDPETEFPNAGAIFLPSRSDFKAFDLVAIRPIVNFTYQNRDTRDCYFVPEVNGVRVPDKEELEAVHSVLTVPALDPDSRVIPSPAQLVTPVFFVKDLSRQGRLLGPLRRMEVRRVVAGEAIESIHWMPDSPDGLAWSFPQSALAASKLRLETYEHPRHDLNEILKRPYEFVVGKVEPQIEGGSPVDLASQTEQIRFFLSTAHVDIPEPALRALAEIPGRPGTDTPAFMKSRYDRLSRILRVARELESERRRIALEFLETEEGRREVAAAIAEAKAEARAEVRAEMDIEEERKRLQAELRALEERKAGLEENLRAERERHEHEAGSLRKLIAELSKTAELEGLRLEEKVLDQVPALIALAGVRPARLSRDIAEIDRAGERTAAPARIEIQPLPAARAFRKVEDEALYVRWLRDELALMGLHFSLEIVANVFACLKCSPLTLLGGPPGVGKSSLVRALPPLLGQEHCFLELSVRRTWADDRALLGFPDTFHRRYEPGTTGFVPHLVRAMKDLEGGKNGIYMVLLDEFNLAPPEYYFSEFLRILQKPPDDRKLRLHTSGLEDDPIPPEISAGSNVSFWGTVNLDETTEALSPRLLDRVHFIIIGTEDIETPAAAQPPAKSAALGPYSYATLMEARARDTVPNPEAKTHVDRALAILRDSRTEWGPGLPIHPRQVREIERYLAAARPVLSATAAADLVINQRVLPGLRGRGEGFRRRMEALRDHMAAASLRRSSSRLDRILLHAEENYDAFDFNVY